MAEPAMVGLATAELATAEPAMAELATAEPAMAELVMAEPAMAELVMAEPVMVKVAMTPCQRESSNSTRSIASHRFDGLSHTSLLPRRPLAVRSEQPG